MTKPPAGDSRGPRRCSWVGVLFRRQDLEHSGPAHGADALQRGSAVRHFHLLPVGNGAFRLAFDTVALIRSHRSLSSLRHITPPLGAGGKGAGRVGVCSLRGNRPPQRRSQHNTACSTRGSRAGRRGVGEPVPFVSPVTKGLRGRAPTTAQDNDFRRAAIAPGGTGSSRPSGVTIRTGPWTTRGPLGFGVIIRGLPGPRRGTRAREGTCR